MIASRSLRLLGISSALAALALSAGMSGRAYAATNAIHTTGNSAAAHACQKGGYQNYMNASLTPFANPGACTSYAGTGGTPQPVPDLQLNHSCSPGDAPGEYVSCTFTVTNIGAGPTVGGVTLEAIAETSDGSPALTNCEASCPTEAGADVGTCSVPTFESLYESIPGQASANATCADSIPAGGSSPLTIYVKLTPQNAGTGVAVSATVLLDQPSQEPNQSNNSFSATYPTSGGPPLLCCG